MAVVTASAFLGSVTNPANAASHQTVSAPARISGSTPVPVAQVLQTGTVGTAYSETISAQGGVSPYSFAVTTGGLPAGLALNSSTGVISGTPTAAATYNFTIEVTDANGWTGTQAFRIIVGIGGGSGALTWAA